MGPYSNSSCEDELPSGAIVPVAPAGAVPASGGRLSALCESLQQILRDGDSTADTPLLGPARILQTEIERELAPRIEEGLRSVLGRLRSELLTWEQRIDDLERLTDTASNLARPAGHLDPRPVAGEVICAQPAEDDEKRAWNAVDVPHGSQDSRPAEAYFQHAEDQANQENFSAAIAAYTDALRLDPSYVAALLGRSKAHHADGNLSAALADLSRVLTHGPDDIDALMLWGGIQADCGETERALAAFSRVIALDPRHAQAHLDRAALLVKLGDLEQAVDDADLAIHLNPRLAQAYYILGVAHARWQHYQRALTSFTFFLQIRPQALVARYQRGVTFRLAGEPARAISDFNAVLAAAPDYALAYYQRGLAREAEGALADALLDYTRAVELDPELEEVQECCARLNERLAPAPKDVVETPPPPSIPGPAVGSADTPAPARPPVRAVPEKRLPVARPRPSASAEQTRVDDAKSALTLVDTPVVSTPPAPVPQPVAKVQQPKSEPAKEQPPKSELAKDQRGTVSTVMLTCPECDHSGEVRVDRLNQKFICQGCRQVYAVDAGGTLRKLQRRVPVRRTWKSRLTLKRLLILSAAVVLAGLSLLLWKDLASHSAASDATPLPLELEPRAEIMAKAWVNNDLILMRRLTLPSHGKRIRQWLAHQHAPQTSDEMSRAQAAQEWRFDMNVLQDKKTAVLLELNLHHPARPALKVVQYWVQEDGTWFFMPFGETEDRKLRSAPTSVPRRVARG